MTEETIFATALEKRTPAEREAYLDDACGADATLRHQVEALLKAYTADAGFLEVAAAVQVAAAVPPDATEADHTTADESAAAGPDDLSFLAPPHQPGHLGRLDHYEIHEVVGRGGMGVVLKAFDEKLHRIVAIKVLAPQLATSATARRRFLREAHAAAAVAHEHVVAIHAVEDGGSIPYLVMQFVSGCSLEERLKRSGPLQVKEILRIGMQAACGLAAAHAQGLVHRDIKPANILLENGIERVKLTDFGLARAMDDASLTQSGVIAGTPMFMAPEQARGEAVDPRADLFSLGSVLYTLCTGRPPFRASTTMGVLKRVSEDAPRPIREVNAEVPDWLEAIVMKLLAKKPAQRFQTAAEVAELLGQHLAHLQQPHLVAQPAMIVMPAPGRRRRWLVAVLLVAAIVPVAAVLLLVIGLGFGAYLLWHDLSDEPKPAQGEPFVPRPPRTEAELTALPSPLDARKRDDIPPGLLALAGNGDPGQAPQELVAVLGDDRFRLPQDAKGGRIDCSPDGSLLAVASGPTVVLFDAKSGEYRKTLRGLTGRVFPIAFSPDGKSVAAGGWSEGNVKDFRVIVWNVESGQATIFPGHPGNVMAIRFSHDSKYLYSGGEDKLVRVWDIANKKELPPLTGHQAPVVGLAPSPDGTRLVSAGWDGIILIWDLNKRQVQKTLADHQGPGHHGKVSGLAFSRDGALLASGDEKGIFLWNTATWEKAHSLVGPGEWLAFAADGKVLMTAPIDSAGDKPYPVTLWDVATGAQKPSYSLNSRGGFPQYCLSPDAKTLYAWRCNPAEAFVHRYDAATGQELLPPQGHTGQVWTVAFSPDGKTLASAGEDGIVQVWDLTGWQAGAPLPPMRKLIGHTDTVWSVAFSPDGTLLASGSYGGVIIVWNLADGRMLRTLPGPAKVSSTLAFSPDGKTLACGRDDQSVWRWDVATGEVQEPLRCHAGPVAAVAFSPDGRFLASKGRTDQTVCLADAATGEVPHRFRNPSPGQQNLDCGLAFSPDSRALAFGGEKDIRVLDLQTKAETVLQGHTDRIRGLAFHPAGRLLASASADRTIRIWDRSSPGRVLTIGPGPFGEMAREVAFDPSGRYLATSNWNGTIAILRTPTPPAAYAPGSHKPLPDPAELAKRPSAADALKREDIPRELLTQAGGGDAGKAAPEIVAILKHGDKQLGTVAFSPDGKLLGSAGNDGTTKLWELATGKLLHTLAGHPQTVYSFAFSPNSKLPVLEAVTLHTTVPVYSFAFSPNSKLLATVSKHDDTVRLWDVEHGTEVRTFAGPRGGLLRVAFSPDGRTLAAGGYARTIGLWDVDSGQPIRTLHGAAGVVDGLAFSPDGKVLAAAGPNGTLCLWDLASGWVVATLVGHQKDVRGVAWLPDGVTLASSSDDGTIRLWDLATMTEKRQLTGTRTKPVTVACRADGRLLASDDSEEGTIRLWDLTAEVLRSREIRFFPPQTWFLHGAAFSPEGRYLATANPDGTAYILRLAKQGEVFEVPADQK